MDSFPWIINFEENPCRFLIYLHFRIRYICGSYLQCIDYHIWSYINQEIRRFQRSNDRMALVEPRAHLGRLGGTPAGSRGQSGNTGSGSRIGHPWGSPLGPLGALVDSWDFLLTFGLSDAKVRGNKS